MQKDEQETIVNIAAVDDYAEIYSGIPKHMNRLRKWSELGLCEIMFDHGDDVKVKVPLNNLFFNIRKPRQLTEEQLEAAKARMEMMRLRKGKNKCQTESLPQSEE